MYYSYYESPFHFGVKTYKIASSNETPYETFEEAKEALAHDLEQTAESYRDASNDALELTEAESASYLIRLDLDNEYTEENVRAFIDAHPQGKGMSRDTALGLMFADWLKDNAERLALEHAYTIQEDAPGADSLTGKEVLQ